MSQNLRPSGSAMGPMSRTTLRGQCRILASRRAHSNVERETRTPAHPCAHMHTRTTTVVVNVQSVTPFLVVLVPCCRTNMNWLKSRFHLNFAEYHGGKNQYGIMRVMNDDLVQPHRGFGTHPHSNMEIVTYIVQVTSPHLALCG